MDDLEFESMLARMGHDPECCGGVIFEDDGTAECDGCGMRFRWTGRREFSFVEGEYPSYTDTIEMVPIEPAMK